MLLLILLSKLLFAEGMPLVISEYTTNKPIDTAHINEYASKFTKIEKSEFKFIIFSKKASKLKQDIEHQFTWIMLELDENLSTGNYWIEHTAFDFTEHTFENHQSIEKFSMLGRKFLSFYYHKNQDNRIYFLKVLSAKSSVAPFASLYTPQSFSTWVDTYEINLLLSFFLLGLIFMTVIYNGSSVIFVENYSKTSG